MTEGVGAILQERSSDPNPSGELKCCPTFWGSRQAPALRGSFSEITPHNFTLGGISHAVMEGIVEGMFQFAQKAEEAGISLPEMMIGTGNGLQKNPQLGQMIARRFGCDVYMPLQTEAAAYGTALLVGRQIGIWNSLTEACAKTELKLTFRPDA